jgi:hypothetical protein
MIAKGLGELDKSGIAELTFKARHNIPGSTRDARATQTRSVTPLRSRINIHRLVSRKPIVCVFARANPIARPLAPRSPRQWECRPRVLCIIPNETGHRAAAPRAAADDFPAAADQLIERAGPAYVFARGLMSPRSKSAHACRLPVCERFPASRNAFGKFEQRLIRDAAVVPHRGKGLFSPTVASLHIRNSTN